MAVSKPNTTLAQKLVQMTAEIAKRKIDKNGTNDYHKYKYVKASDISAIIAEQLAALSIASIVVPEVLESKDITNAKGNVEHLVTVKVDILLVDADSGDTMTITGLGSGQDASDKAVMKAQTAALKYAYMMSFNIATNDDPEADGDSAKELPEQKSKQTATPKPKAATKGNDKVERTCACRECGVVITEKVHDYSKQKYGTPLCYECQKSARQSA